MSLFSIGSKKPKLPSHPSVWVSETASVVGDVVIGSDVSVWFGAAIRGDNDKIVLGSGSNIQENCVLHTDVGSPIKIGKNCTIGHGAIIHGCTIGNNCIIGMGAIILNGAKIGDHCIVGAGALIPEGKNFSESGKLILGFPAKVTRNLKLYERNKILESASGYQLKATKFKTKLKQY